MKIEVAWQFSIKFSNIKFQENLPSSFSAVSCAQMDGLCELNRHFAELQMNLGEIRT
jgi:hypothetical protein